ncbi:U32 family peptidase [Macrococcoides goetzii]|nr:peptidase U32 family protein [Macrococcus goetzii]TDM42631.1 U32 family peptidase [Macrococcus goetzii]TDM46387.1 U32 family peptidase [Macrococcus goetzii]TDM49873.1 U32 family peptidase [Macrococcus goetzii]
MTELLVTPKSLSHISDLIEAGADAFVIGEEQFGLRLAGEFDREDLKAAIDLIHEHNKKAYVAVNGIFHNEHLNAVEDYMKFLHVVKPDAILFGDPAIVMYERELGNTIPLQWNQETLVTNYFQVNYWGQRGANRAVLARELSLDEVLNIKAHTDVAIEVQVHGMTCMFQSKRSLLGNYFMYQDKVMKIENREIKDAMLLYDEERNNKYPIFEDSNGTHIMSPNDICVIEELEELIEAGIDSFKVDGILHSEEYITTVTKAYRQALDLYDEDVEAYEDAKFDLVDMIEEIQPEHRPLDQGFLFKQTVY